MKERPILMHGRSVRAILAGTKTQTRRPVKLTPTQQSNYDFLDCEDAHDARLTFGDGYGGLGLYAHCTEYPDEGSMFFGRCPYGVPGDRLWVRESFNWSSDSDLLANENHRKCAERRGYTADNVVWRADGEREHPVWGSARWRPSIHMPRWASRLTLELTEVRVERVQAISEADARAEGITDGGCLTCGCHEPCGCANPQPDARDAFVGLWNDTNAHRPEFAWDRNPWVWVLTFRRVAP